ncbi:MAG: hypothetical protein ACKVVP_08565 [Chloroflexota bacterium]
MAKELPPIDITTDHDLLRLAEEVRRTGEARLLRRGDDDVAVLSPAPGSTTQGASSRSPSASPDAFLSSFGSWADIVDADELKRTIREARSDRRPPVEL